MIIRNKYHVPRKRWAGWTRRARFVFNELYKQIGNMEVIAGSAMGMPPQWRWRVIRWNTAWLAADLVQSPKAWAMGFLARPPDEVMEKMISKKHRDGLLKHRS